MATATLDHTTDATETGTAETGLQVPTSTFNLTIHNGAVTVRRTDTGVHHTYSIETVQRGPLKGKRIAKSREGASYQSFAFITEDGRVCVWRRFRSEETGDTFFDRSARMLERLYHLEAKGKVEVMIEGRCRRCNRVLTHPESLATGLGPVCAGLV